MIILRTFALLLLCATCAYAQGGSFIMPVEGVQNRDYFLVNHVDHDTGTPGIRDYNCGAQTYDGHKGLDITLRSFRQMDSGVAVLAAAPGRVTEVTDTAYDRNKRVNIPLGFGNYIMIAHPDSLYTYYAHIRKGSAKVKVGDMVTQGQQIALTGSSGNSTDPHCHFEVYRNYTLTDPFAGPCAGNKSYWATQPAYDTGRGVIDHGMLGYLPTLDTLRERPPSKTAFTPADSVITIWIHEYGLRVNDTSRIEWLAPDGSNWFTYEYIHDAPSRYFYYWTYINTPPPRPGQWKAVYSINSRQMVTRTFTVQSTLAVHDSPSASVAGYKALLEKETLRLTIPEGAAAARLLVDVYDTRGGRVSRLYDGASGAGRRAVGFPALPPGVYFVRVVHGSFTLNITVTR